jgi:hypothetical protein
LVHLTVYSYGVFFSSCEEKGDKERKRSWIGEIVKVMRSLRKQTGEGLKQVRKRKGIRRRGFKRET